MSLLARDETSFRDDVRAAPGLDRASTSTPRRSATATALATLKQVGETPVTISPPDINASLAAVRTARTAREKR